MRGMPGARAVLVSLAVGVALGAVPRAWAQAPPAPASPDEERVGVLHKDARDALRAGDPAKAITIAREAAGHACALGLEKLQCAVRVTTLARALTFVGEHAAALRELEACHAYFVRVGDVVNQFQVPSNRGVVLRLLGDFD